MRFFASFLRGCPKAILNNASKLSLLCVRSFSIKSTAEVTFGGGTNASGSTSKQIDAFPAVCAKTERAQNSFSPTAAENFSATSFWIITNIDWQLVSFNALRIMLVAI